MLDESVPLRAIRHPFAFPHIFPILLALIKRKLVHSLELVWGEGLGEVGESGLYCGSLAGELQLHHLKGEEGVSCVPLGFLKLLEDMRTLSDCRVVNPTGIDA